MAIYTYRCGICGKRSEVYQSIKAYCESPDVPVCCGSPSARFLTAPLVSFDTAPWAAYQSPIDGTVIDSRSKRNEHMARHGVVMFDEIEPDIDRNRRRIVEDTSRGLKEEVIAATQMVESGHKPKVYSEAEFNQF